MQISMSMLFQANQSPYSFVPDQMISNYA